MADDMVSPFSDDDATQILRGLISPAPAQALVLPPPDRPPHSGPGESTPLTGNLAAAPSQATPKRSPAPDPQPPSPHPADQAKPASGTLRGLAAYLFGGNDTRLNAQVSPMNADAARRTTPALVSIPALESGTDASNDPSADSSYVKVLSNGQVGYLPKVNLAKAQQRDKNLKVLR